MTAPLPSEAWRQRLLSLSPAQRRLFELLAAAQARGYEELGQLVALVVPREGARVDERALREHAAKLLPPPLVPQQIVFVTELPRTPGGKPDRAMAARLAGPAQSQDASPSAEPRNATEQRVQRLFEQVLRAPVRNVFADFFSDLGGHSLLATQLIALARREFRRELPLRLIFEKTNVADFAAAVEASPRAPVSTSPITALERR